MHSILDTLIAPNTCLNTTYARETVAWLNGAIINASYTGNVRYQELQPWNLLARVC